MMCEGGEVFLTGATGFVGGHVLDALLDAGFRVRALVRPGSRLPAAVDHCRVVVGDLRGPGPLARAMEGCDYLVHVAGLYAFAPRERRDLQVTNVRGCAGLLEAARLAGVRRAVVTSSSATVGPARDGRPASEADWADEHEAASSYHRSKVQEERAALAAQLPVVLILPTAPVGPRDRKPTPTGKMVLDFMRGRIFASLPGGLNLVPVEDVARAHARALLLGTPGERYLIGGENLSLRELWERLAAICGRRPPARELPYGVALGIGWA
ncbi:MAG: NAD-dependent epimerase/dehydratase family protein, partial [Chloroflexi bacterium]|nr:NAD-dependent epimerase/dehydratase family protein [Chloroflexota bacterium]